MLSKDQPKEKSSPLRKYERFRDSLTAENCIGLPWRNNKVLRRGGFTLYALLAVCKREDDFTLKCITHLI